MTQIGSIYVSVRGDYTQYAQDMRQLKQFAKKSGEEVSDALGNAISPKQASAGIASLSRNLTNLATVAKVPAENFRITANAISTGLTDVAKKAGLSEKEFAKLNQRMLEQRAYKSAEGSLRQIARAADLSEKEIRQMALQMGYSAREADKMTRAISRQHKEASLAAAAWQRFGAVLVTYFSARQFGQLVTGFIDVAASFEQMELKLDAITKGHGSETLKEINEWALKMPVNTRKAVDTFAMMAAMGLDPNIEKMQTLVDVSVLFGEEAMPRVARALGQMATLGKLSAEELNQLSEAGINARKYLTEAFGKTVEEIQKTGIAIDDIIDVIWKGLDDEFGGATAKAQDTWQGLTAALISYWEEFGRLVAEAGIFEKIEQGMAGVLDQIDELYESGKLAQWATQLSQTLEGLVGTLDVVFSRLETVINFFSMIPGAWWALTGLGKPPFDTGMGSTLYTGLAPYPARPGAGGATGGRTAYDITLGNIAPLPFPFEPGKEIKPIDISRLEEQIARDELKWSEELAQAKIEDLKAVHDYERQIMIDSAKAEEERARESLKQQEDLNKQRLAEEEKALKKMEEEQRHFYERIHDTTADWTYRILDGQIQSWKDAWDVIFDYVKRIIAEMVAYAIARPIVVPIVASVAGALGLGSLVGGSGLAGTATGAMSLAGLGRLGGLGSFLSSPAFGTTALPAGIAGPPAPALASGATWGGLLASAGLGYLGADLLFGGKGQSGLGGGAGSALGFALGGPLGAVLGGLGGGFLGSLFGGGKPHKFRAEIGWQGGSAYTRGWGRGAGMYSGVLGQIGEQIQAAYGSELAALEEMASAFGMGIPAFEYTTLVRSRDPQQAAKRVMDELEQAYSDYITDVATSLGYAAAEEMFAAFNEALTASSQLGASALQQAFDAHAGFGTFANTLRRGVFEAVKGGLIDAFVESQAYQQIMAPTLLGIEKAYASATKYGGFNQRKFMRTVTPLISDFTADIESLAPLFSAYQNVLSQVDMLFAGGMPVYQHGTDFVPRTGPAIVHRGEQIVPARENRSARMRPAHFTIELGGRELADFWLDASRDGRIQIHQRGIARIR